jgi:hypothetical protein
LRATVTAANRASKAGDDLFASLILLALRRYRNKAQCDNARLCLVVASFRPIVEVIRVQAPTTKNHEIVNTRECD